jgi:8-oxo-dGTP pyrophosphatase MutT (NUDIX family)
MMNEKGDDLLILLGIDKQNFLVRLLGGHVEVGEESETAANRELQEESTIVLYNKDIIDKFSINRKLLSRVQESRRGLRLEPVNYSLLNNKIVIPKTGLNLTLERNEAKDIKVNKDITLLHYTYNNRYLNINYYKFGVKLYQVVGNITDGNYYMQSDAFYSLYKYNNKIANRAYGSNDANEKLVSMFVDMKLLKKYIKYDMFQWESHVGILYEGLSYFKRYIPHDDEYYNIRKSKIDDNKNLILRKQVV